MDRLFGAAAQVRFTTVQGVLKDGPPPPKSGSEGYTHALIYLLRKDCRSVQELVRRCQLAMGPAGSHHVFIHHWRGETESSNFSHELVNYVEDIIGSPPRGAVCSFVGGSLKRFNARLFIRLAHHYSRYGKWALLWILPPLAVVLTLTLMANLYLILKLPSRNYVEYCSSAAIRFTPGAGTTREAALRSQEQHATG